MNNIHIRTYSDKVTTNSFLDRMLSYINDKVVVNNEIAQVENLKLDFLEADLKEPSQNIIYIIDLCNSTNIKTIEKLISGNVSLSSKKNFYIILKSNYLIDLDYPKAYLDLNKNHIAISFFSNSNTQVEKDKLELNFNSFLNENKSNIFNTKNNIKNILFIGGSIGAIPIIHEILENLNLKIKNKSFNRQVDYSKLPPIIITQHITNTFSKKFIGRLSNILPFYKVISLDSAFGNLPVENGSIYISINEHTVMSNAAGNLLIKAEGDELVSEHCPSIDVMLKTGKKALSNTFNFYKTAVILTGMGFDGVEGMKEFSTLNNCTTMAQDSESSIVHGIASKAIESGSIKKIGNASKLSDFIFAEFEKTFF